MLDFQCPTKIKIHTQNWRLHQCHKFFKIPNESAFDKTVPCLCNVCTYIYLPQDFILVLHFSCIIFQPLGSVDLKVFARISMPLIYAPSWLWTSHFNTFYCRLISSTDFIVSLYLWPPIDHPGVTTNTPILWKVFGELIYISCEIHPGTMTGRVAKETNTAR